MGGLRRRRPPSVDTEVIESMSAAKQSTPGQGLMITSMAKAHALNAPILVINPCHKLRAKRKAGPASQAFFYCDLREDQKKGLREYDEEDGRCAGCGGMVMNVGWNVSLMPRVAGCMIPQKRWGGLARA
jgi:hypothetical protein